MQTQPQQPTRTSPGAVRLARVMRAAAPAAYAHEAPVFRALAETVIRELVAAGRAPAEWWQVDHEVRVRYCTTATQTITGGRLELLARAIDAAWEAYLTERGVVVVAGHLRRTTVDGAFSPVATGAGAEHMGRAAADAAHAIAEIEAA